MDETSFFVDRTGATAPPIALWPSVIIPKEAIDAEIERLSGLARPANGLRRSLIVHPNSKAPGLGLAPGIRVSLDVLMPGESTPPIRHNSSQVNFCIAGSGTANVAGKRFGFNRHDVWNTPSMDAYVIENATSQRQVRLTYSNAALLEKMNVHIVDEDPPAAALELAPEASGPAEAHDQNPFGTFELGEGAYLMPYEKLVNPDVVPSRSLFWKWDSVKEHLDKLEALGQAYRGRRLYLLFNPATGHTNGTTHNFFATMCLRPANIVDRPHRHTAAAINYYFEGSGYSIVEGTRFDWKAGDLMLSAPGWGIHNHASNDKPVYELTIQDSPLNIAMGSLLWQENLSQPAAVLGAQNGFVTNRETVGAAT
jgi:gentisate 1,2-dioxygenase